MTKSLPEDPGYAETNLSAIITDEINISRKKRYGPEVVKLFSSSAQLSMKFQLLIDVEIVKISGKFGFRTQKTTNLSCS